ncbi:MAG: hypothetical protein OXH81_22295 [Gemmatimonadetes bacterium]|nr:hypothetical protein [Gemmatimonadota bacterium]MDE2737112.1 hypothetical protein [Gemmatimonadota bacterium]
MSGVLQVAIGVCLIILCCGLVNWGNKYYSSRKRRDKKSEQEEDRIVKRLERVEQRLTEVQDVMIAVSEKIDRLEVRERG